MSSNVYIAGVWKPVLSTPTTSSSEIGNSSEKPQDQLVNQTSSESAPREGDASRSASQEPATGTEGSDGSGGSDNEEQSPVKTGSKSQRSSSRSPSPEVQKKQLSVSPSPGDQRKLSRSTSSPRRSPSKSTSRRKLSRFVLWYCICNSQS